MKQRIISGAVMAGIVILVLFLGLNFSTQIMIGFLAIVAALGVYELVANAAKVENIVLKILPSIYTIVMVFLFSTMCPEIYQLNTNISQTGFLSIEALVLPIIITVVYVIAMGILCLVFQKDLDLAKIAVLCGFPLIYSFAFSTIASIIIIASGIYYLLLALNFACVCDIGAYFVGVKFGKTKLCPEISPKKTVEGALGGLASGIIVALIIVLCYGFYNRILPTLLFTVPLCVVGMAGDLFASIIKRKVGLKDYGNLIPGHGGILDRVDSLLFVVPLMYCLIVVGLL
ncbi:MAG: phosphatidate cytidylyltransferase [Clostridia bacterium]|nr:phosphatidate cytidylyltransferase [Clostridia bacterium]